MLFLAALLGGCRSDKPQPATAEVPALGMRVTVTRVATHPFLARYNLRLSVEGPAGCRASGDLFPDTGGVSRRNLYQTPMGVTVLGQFDARVIDVESCTITLIEFRSLAPDRVFLGAFDEDAGGRWAFLPRHLQPERPFDAL